MSQNEKQILCSHGVWRIDLIERIELDLINTKSTMMLQSI